MRQSLMTGKQDYSLPLLKGEMSFVTFFSAQLDVEPPRTDDEEVSTFIINFLDCCQQSSIISWRYLAWGVTLPGFMPQSWPSSSDCTWVSQSRLPQITMFHINTSVWMKSQAMTLKVHLHCKLTGPAAWRVSGWMTNPLDVTTCQSTYHMPPVGLA